MGEVSKEQEAKSRETESTISQRISQIGQINIYEALGIDKDAFGRFYGNKNGFGLRQFSRALTMVGLKVVPIAARITPPDSIAVPHSIVITAFRDAYQLHGKDSPQVKEYTTRLIAAGVIQKTGGVLSIPIEALFGD